jgi:signal transduction histidine kinase
MKKSSRPLFRGLTVQVLAITVLPLTLLLLFIAFSSVFLHQQDMRSLVGERDERAVQAAAAALDAELHHRASNISSLVEMAELVNKPVVIKTTADLVNDFDGGIAYLTPDRQLITTTGNPQFWKNALQANVQFANATGATSGSKTAAIFSGAFIDPQSKRSMVIVSQYSVPLEMIVAGAFSPQSLADRIISTSYAASERATVYLLDSLRQPLYTSHAETAEPLPADHPGIEEALRGESGALYVQIGENEHVVAYSPITPTGWVLITEESWQEVVSPSLQMTQMAPLVIVPAFLLALVALWFVATRIVQPLQKLEDQAAALAWGDFKAMENNVGGITEIRHLQMELTEMAHKVQSAQEGLHNYIGAITAAQEEERMRLAREIHDDTIQAVVALKQRVQLAGKSTSIGTARDQLRELEDLAEKTVENLRRLTRALRPIYLEDLGLVTALNMLANESGKAGKLNVHFRRIGEERRLSGEVELALYRIAQEALNNVKSHANASEATLAISFDKEIKLEVTDNGVGFTVPKSPTEFAPGGHFGLLGMRERADLIGGRLEVEGNAGKGTRLSVRLSSSLGQTQRERKDV